MIKRRSLRMVIRHYVFGLLNAHPDEEIRIPSYNILAKKFHIARSTAQLELKALVDEGYLITRPGIGTFANLNRSIDSDTSNVPAITTVWGSGDYVYRRFTAISVLRAFEREVAKYPAKIQEIFFSSGTEDQMYEELTELNSHALVWISPCESRYSLIRRIAEKIPVLVLQGTVPGVPCACWDLTPVGYQIGEELVRRELFRFLYLESSNSNLQIWNGIMNAFQKAGVKNCNQYLMRYQNGHKNVEALLQSGYQPNAVFFREEAGMYLMNTLSRYGIDPRKDCLMISATYKPRALTAPLLLVELPFEGLGAYAAELLFQIMEKKKIPEKNIFIPEKISVRTV